MKDLHQKSLEVESIVIIRREELKRSKRRKPRRRKSVSKSNKSSRKAENCQHLLELHIRKGKFYSPSVPLPD